MADYSKLANDALADLRKVRERWPNYGDSDLERLANALLNLERERDNANENLARVQKHLSLMASEKAELIKVLEAYRHCRHACISCFCTDAAIVAVALAKLKGGTL